MLGRIGKRGRRLLRVAVDEYTGDAQATKQQGEFRDGILADDIAGIGIDLLDLLAAGRGVQPKLVWPAGFPEVLVQLRDERLQIGRALCAHRRRSCRSGRRVPICRQGLAACPLNRCRCRRLTSVHGARRRYAYRNSVARHVAYTHLTKLLLRILLRLQAASSDHCPGACAPGQSHQLNLQLIYFDLSAVTAKA